MMPGILSIQSHVVYGHAGNSSAVFPLQRMGFEVWPLHTVQFSNHTQYAHGWTGKAFSSDEMFDLVRGLDNLSALANCQAVITGYQGSMEQCKTIVDTVSLVKERNPEALYVCDPVMGSPEKGCIVSPGIAETLIESVMPMADIIVPNQFELSQFTGRDINSIEEAIVACQLALTKGPKMVLVKHLHCISGSSFSMMLATKDNCYLAQRPHLKFVKDPVGVGDLITALFTAGVLKGWEPEKAFGHSNNASYGILKETSSRGQWELQTIAAQQEIVGPAEVFPLQQLVFDEPQIA